MDYFSEVCVCNTPLAIHAIARPLNPTDIIQRKDTISLKKYQAEGPMEEQNRCLDGYLIQDIISHYNLFHCQSLQ